MLDFLKNTYCILDGAFGTRLQGLGLFDTPEIYNITKPDCIIDIHKSYVDAGSNVIYTNTFGANAYKLNGTGYSPEQIISTAITNAKKAMAVSDNVMVAQSIGPIGKLLYPLGDLSFDNAYGIFKEQVLIGIKNGIDLFVVETMTDLLEAKCAVLAVKENSDKPVFCSMSFEENGKTFLGVDPVCMALTLEGLGIDAIGINCSIGPDKIYPMAKQIVENCNLPIFIKANAGLPNPESGKYDIDKNSFVEYVLKLATLGINIFGGCCGTDETYIKEISNVLKRKKIKKRKHIAFDCVCSDRIFVSLNKFNIIGERLNPTGKKALKQALIDENYDYLVEQAVVQLQDGADILDINAGLGEIDEGEVLKNAVLKIQSSLAVPLQIDTASPDVLEKVLKIYKGIPIINSTTGDIATMEKIMPLAKKYGAYLVCLTLDEAGLKKTLAEKTAVVKKAVAMAEKYGIEKCKLIIDCLALTASTNQDDIKHTLNGVKKMTETFKLKTVLGISNVSFGLPERGVLNAAFLTMAIQNGLSMCIINPNDEMLQNAIAASNVLTNADKNCRNYIDRFNKNTCEKSTQDIVIDLNYAILKGLGDKVNELTLNLLKTLSPLEVVEKHLLPALDIVGEKYETNEIYLPELIKASESAKRGFTLVQSEIAKTTDKKISKGKILLATVKGDIHDIGKNIVKVVLENYGYEIVDLGFDISPEQILKTVSTENIKCVGLSALMTTTLKNMKETINLLKINTPNVKVMVGGAVLTEKFALSIGADAYAKDAKACVDVVKRLI